MIISLVIGDVHLNEVYSEYFRCILFPFLRHVHQQKKYNRVIFIGDVFDASSLNNATSKLFKELLSIYSDIEVILLNGNHDKITSFDTIYDVMILPQNVTVYKDVTYVGNNIFVPHIDKSLDHHTIFQDINKYIKSNNLKEVYIYSHNDFAEIYKFKNNFFSVTSAFENIHNPCYLINGHNHVPFFKERDSLYIFNIGCSLNTNFNDSCLYNYFLIVDESQESFVDKFDLFQNKYSIHYHTFHIWKEDHIYELCTKLSKDNYTYVKFKIHDPSIVIDNNLKNSLQESYNIIDIVVDYELDDIAKIATNTIEDSTSLSDLCSKLNIKIEEFEKFEQLSTDKHEILFTLLNIMFESRETSANDIEKVIETIKKYIL